MSTSTPTKRRKYRTDTAPQTRRRAYRRSCYLRDHVASKSAQQEPEKAEVIEEALDALDQAFDRVKVLYEQYFLGIQKQPPQFLHGEVERKLRDLAELQIR